MTVIQIFQLIGALISASKTIYGIIEEHRASGKGDAEPLSPEHVAAVKAAIASVNPLGDPDGPE